MENKEAIQYKNEDTAVFRINPKIYPVDVVHSAAYILLDKAFILLDGNPEIEIIAEITSKQKGASIKELVWEFNDELLNYSVYKSQNEKNKKLREILMKRVLITNEVVKRIDDLNQKINAKREKIEDPEKIFQSWEEKNDNNKTQ